MEFETAGTVSDRQDVQFGIREITSELDAQQHRLFKINGKNILIRGGGWSPDMLLRYDDEREENEIRYARDMNLNTIRLEGKMMNEHFFETCDRHGILVMAGLVLLLLLGALAATGSPKTTSSPASRCAIRSAACATTPASSRACTAATNRPTPKPKRST